MRAPSLVLLYVLVHLSWPDTGWEASSENEGQGAFHHLNLEQWDVWLRHFEQPLIS